MGIFGGTFDPPHLGHLAVAGDVVTSLGLDELVWVVARHPPHKLDVEVTPADVRLEMTRAAVGSDPRFRVSDLEIRREGPSFTVDTLRALSSEGTELILVMGIDQYRELETWRSPDEVRRLATIAVMDRAGDSVGEGTIGGGSVGRDTSGVEAVGEARSTVGRAVLRLPVRRVDVSGTDIRARVARGEDIGDLVPEAVARIIAERGLYRG